ncbi:MAG: high-potential iron-sulfur protein [Vitreoscilla sp.]
MTSRRTFIQILPLAGALALGTRAALAAAAPQVDPKDPQASALGYVADASKADKAKFPKYAAGQACGSCQLYQGKPADAGGPCAIFAGKQVLSKAWCSAYIKKA